MNCVETINIDDFGSKICEDSKKLKQYLDEYTSILENVKKESKTDYEFYKNIMTHIKILNKLSEFTDETGKLLKEIVKNVDNYSGGGLNG